MNLEDLIRPEPLAPVLPGATLVPDTPPPVPMPQAPMPAQGIPAPPSPTPAPPPSSGGGGFDWNQLLAILPMALAGFQSGKNPHASSALMEGVLRGQQLAQQEQRQRQQESRLQAQQDSLAQYRAEQEQRQRDEFQANWVQGAAEALSQITDPVEHRRMAEAFEAEAVRIGIPAGTVQRLAVYPQSRADAATRKEAAGLIAAFQKQYPDVDPSTVSVPLESQGGKRVTVSELIQAYGMVGANGKPVTPTETGPLTRVEERDARGRTTVRYLLPSEVRGQTFVQEPLPKAASGSGTAADGEGDADTLAQMLVDGTLLPSMMSRRAETFNAILAKANKLSIKQTGQPVNFVKLQTDYNAAQRFVSNMNGAQMIRFRALADSVVSTINEVRELGRELQQGNVQLWNRARRGTILQVYGNTPQSALAARYVGAVNTLKEEFANLAQGGYAPTEAAWHLANGQINGDFGAKDLDASLREVQRLINYRIQAFDEQTPRTLGGPSVLPGVGGGPTPPPVTAPDGRVNPYKTPK